jgi:hypothetical protein
MGLMADTITADTPMGPIPAAAPTDTVIALAGDVNREVLHAKKAPAAVDQEQAVWLSKVRRSLPMEES